MVLSRSVKLPLGRGGFVKTSDHGSLMLPRGRLLFSCERNTVQAMSTKAHGHSGRVRALPPEELQAVWQELGRRLGQAVPTAPVALYGEPLTEADIEQSARVRFQMLDEEERRAETR